MWIQTGGGTIEVSEALLSEGLTVSHLLLAGLLAKIKTLVCSQPFPTVSKSLPAEKLLSTGYMPWQGHAREMGWCSRITKVNAHIGFAAAVANVSKCAHRGVRHITLYSLFWAQFRMVLRMHFQHVAPRIS